MNSNFHNIILDLLKEYNLTICDKVNYIDPLQNPNTHHDECFNKLEKLKYAITTNIFNYTNNLICNNNIKISFWAIFNLINQLNTESKLVDITNFLNRLECLTRYPC